jgi:hypothetical protein
MKAATIASVALAALILGGCKTREYSHLQFPTVENRDWWKVSATPVNTVALTSSDSIGLDSYQYGGDFGRSGLAVGDALGSVSFQDTFAYAEAARQHRADSLATVPITD